MTRKEEKQCHTHKSEAESMDDPVTTNDPGTWTVADSSVGGT